MTATKEVRVFRKTQNLRTRTLLYLLLLLSAFALVIYWSTSYLLGQSLQQFEERHAQEELEQVRAVLDAQAQAMQRSSRDYSIWDDTFEYLRQGNRDYLTTNYTRAAMHNLRVDFVIFLTDTGQFHSAVDGHTGQPEALSVNSAQLREVLSGFAALPPDLLQHGAHLLRWIDRTPAILAFSPIHDSSGSQPRRGWLVMGRLLDDDGQAELTQLVSTAFQLALAAEGVQTPRRPPNSIRASRVLEDSLGNSALRLIIQHPPILHRQKYAGDLLLIGNSLVILLLAVLAVAALLDRLILKRLRLFLRLAEQRHHVDEPPVWPVQGHDELDKLAQSLNELMAEVHSAHTNLYQDARKDPLTGLGNRKFLGERLPFYQAMQQRQPELSLVLYLIDLDDFKLINDCLGHAAGDALLDGIAQRLRSLIRASDTAVRIGGDEFVVLSLTESVGQGSHILAQRLLEEICQPLMFQGSRLAISGSIGIAHAAPGMSQEELLRNADIAMYQAKRAGKSRYAFFSAAMHASVQERMFIEQRLREALVMSQLEVWYQPIIDCTTLDVVMVEALAR